MGLERVKITTELADGTVHDLVIGNVSMVAFDRARAQYKWPKAGDAPVLWMTFLAWHHMKLTGLLSSDTKYETFENELCVVIQDTDEEARVEAEAEGRKFEGDAVDPTETNPEPAYASP